MIELIDVTQHYGVRPVLRGISLRNEVLQKLIFPDTSRKLDDYLRRFGR